MAVLAAIPSWLWLAALLVLGLGYFVERLVGELRAIRGQLQDLSDELALRDGSREDEGAPARRF